MEEGLAVAAARKKLLEKRAEQAARLPEPKDGKLFPWCAIPSDLGYIVRPRALPSLTSPRGHGRAKLHAHSMRVAERCLHEVSADGGRGSTTASIRSVEGAWRFECSKTRRSTA